MLASNRHYPTDQSPLFKVTSPRKLAGVLGLTTIELERMAACGADNYRQFSQKTKPGKAPRWIETPKRHLYPVQRRIHDLLARISPPDFLYSGFPRRSAVQNANQHAPRTRVVKLDIKSFYPSSDGVQVFHFFVNDMKCAEDVAAILMKLTTMPANEKIPHRHLPTGGVTSPILAYYAYRPMFDEFTALASERGLRMTVMVDDITFSGERADHILLREARDILFGHGLESKRSKERVFAARRNKIVTGVVLTNQGPRLPNDRRERIDKFWREVQTEKKPVEQAKLYQRLSGATFSAAQIEPQFQQQGLLAQQLWRNDAAAWRERGGLSRKNGNKRGK